MKVTVPSWGFPFFLGLEEANYLNGQGVVTLPSPLGVFFFSFVLLDYGEETLLRLSYRPLLGFFFFSCDNIIKLKKGSEIVILPSPFGVFVKSSSGLHCRSNWKDCKVTVPLRGLLITS